MSLVQQSIVSKVYGRSMKCLDTSIIMNKHVYQDADLETAYQNFCMSTILRVERADHQPKVQLR